MNERVGLMLKHKLRILLKTICSQVSFYTKCFDVYQLKYLYTIYNYFRRAALNKLMHERVRQTA